ncbi:unnamed protein product [Caenorhabditis auriculariae]|uniref:Uncharacterized protein n=1 Tax=Caenorhabditis auriculariae TaxID=2777116 RepID=A0A8S1H4D7_9PELO|nr:unnamed protein product [Caenorhabditis auriculariae]
MLVPSDTNRHQGPWCHWCQMASKTIGTRESSENLEISTNSRGRFSTVVLYSTDPQAQILGPPTRSQLLDNAAKNSCGRTPKREKKRGKKSELEERFRCGGCWVSRALVGALSFFFFLGSLSAWGVLLCSETVVGGAVLCSTHFTFTVAVDSFGSLELLYTLAYAFIKLS